jgi:hypothetical protein
MPPSTVNKWIAISADGVYELTSTAVRSLEGVVYFDTVAGDPPGGIATLGIEGSAGDFVPIPNGVLTQSQRVVHGSGVKLLLQVTGRTTEDLIVRYAGL